MNITQNFIDAITKERIKARTIPTSAGVPKDAIIAAAGPDENGNQAYLYDSDHGSIYCMSERALAIARALGK